MELTIFDEALEYILYNYRWIFVCLFLLPASVLYDVYHHIRNYIVFKLSSAAHAHDSKVTQVQTQVDTERGVVRVEPLVTMGQLTATLLRLGWTLPVVPELDDLTIGGLIMGTGVETSSHKYGLFQHTCVAFDIIMSDGSLMHCTKTENVDLFHSIPWSYGSLGFLVATEIRIVPAKSHVKITYFPFGSLSDFQEEFTCSSKNMGNDFVEGIVYDQNHAVLMVANFSDFPEDDEKSKVNSIGRFYKPWFFKHVHQILNKKEVTVEYIPLRHYYHRHTKSLFWEVQDIIPFGNHPLFRYLLGWAVPPKVSFLKITQPETVKRLYEKHHVIQDLLIPVEQLGDAVKLMHSLIYPLWVCPMKVTHEAGLLQTASKQDHLYIDLGIYGVSTNKNYKPVETTRAMEKYVRQVSGFQMLYADSYMTREEFREMFKHKLHDLMREKHKCIDAFPDIYDKVCRAARQ